MLLEIKSRQLDFAAPSGSLRVLRGVDLRVERGEVVGLVGESGSGKSTTVRDALRLFPDTTIFTGQVWVNGTEVLGAENQELHRVRSSEVATIRQDPSVSTSEPEPGEVHRGFADRATSTRARGGQDHRKIHGN